jgi:ribosomal-protein-alanine N-acetyltransferase
LKSEVVVRRALVGDIAGVVRVERGVKDAPHWDEYRYWEMVQGGGGGALRRGLFVAVAGPFVVGFVVGSVVLEEAELESVAVDEAWRRRGVASALSEAVFGWARAQGAAQMRLEVRAGNVGAQTLYGRLGFEPCGLRRGYYVDPVEDAVLMAKRLSVVGS